MLGISFSFHIVKYSTIELMVSSGSRNDPECTGTFFFFGGPLNSAEF